MSREIISQGAPFSIAALDRAFGGRAKNVLVVSDGLPSTDPGRIPGGGDLGNILMGGRTVLGDPAAIVTVSGTATNTATLQIQDCAGNAHQGVRGVFVWLSTTAGGGTLAGTTGLTTTATTGVLVPIVANLIFQGLTDATGKLVVQAADASGGETRFVNFLIDGKLFSSAAMINPA